ncbi:serine hydrolase domain-containing protein [Bacteroidota bacterium]
MKRIKILLIGLLVCTTNYMCIGQSNNSVKEDLQYFLDSLIINDSSIYNSVFLVQTPDEIYKIASGLADPANNIKMHVDDQFFGASTTKMLISTIIMLLEEENKLNINDPINKYIEDTLLDGLHTIDGKSYVPQITIKHLLTHTSGLNSFWSDEFIGIMMENQDHLWHPYELIQVAKKSDPATFKPGESWEYTDLGYILLGLIIEKVTKDNIMNVSREILFNPLGMDHTYWQFREKERPSIPGRGPSHCFRGDFDYTYMVSLSADWAGGGMRTTCEDLNKFMQAFLSNDIFKNPETIDRMREWINTEKYGDKLFYGYGIFKYIFDECDHPMFANRDIIIGHQGASGSFMWHFKERNISISGTVNQMNEEKIFEVIINVIRILENK